VLGTVILFAVAMGLAADPGIQDAVSLPTTVNPDEPTNLEDIVVVGTLETRVQSFVREVGAPPRNRYLARWHDPVCIQVVNLEADAARVVIDRVSTVASDLDVQLSRPGCNPNLVVIFVDDARGLASEMVRRNRDVFIHPQLGSFNRGERALERFATSDAPVRWWHMSMPVDRNTGYRSVRLGGDISEDTGKSGSSGRLNSSVMDVLYKGIVIVDVNRLGDTNFDQLADYIAMVGLAQIDPDADIAGHDTVLNIFRQPTSAAGLTHWDMSYLDALYSSTSDRRTPGARQSETAGRMIRAQRAANDEQDN
jgi:hypothetical protein